jgi:hypothetical protein
VLCFALAWYVILVMCVSFVLCLIVVPLPPSEIPSTVKINNNKIIIIIIIIIINKTILEPLEIMNAHAPFANFRSSVYSSR